MSSNLMIEKKHYSKIYNSTRRHYGDVLSHNNPYFNKCLHIIHVFPNKIDINDTLISYLNIYIYTYIFNANEKFQK